MSDPVAVDPCRRVIQAAEMVLGRLNPNVPWSAEALELQHALVAWEREQHRVCVVCCEALSPGWKADAHARCAALADKEGT